MISRRNIRVKVMQTLYTLSSLEAAQIKKTVQQYGADMLEEQLSRSLDLFTIIILYTIRIAQYAERDAANRASKYLPTTDDLQVNTKIAGNTFIWQVLSNNTFTEKVKEAKLERYIDAEWVRKQYQQLAQLPEYMAYAALQERQPKTEKAIIQTIWQKLILGSEAMMELFTDELQGWEDDRDMMTMLMENFFRSSEKVNFLQLVSGEKREYARDLLRTTVEKEDQAMALIKPKLVNWEADRVALIDLLLLRMGVCELLYFPTIPTKVTINEYIEIAKIYSTEQSGHFVNGVLDNILKELEREGKIRKQDRVKKP